MSKLPETMSLYEVERRAARIRHRLLVVMGILFGAVFACGLLAIWLSDVRWLYTTVLCFAAGFAVSVAHRAIQTPEMVPKMAEHYRVRGVTIDESAER